MKLFRRYSVASKREDEAHAEAVNDRIKNVLARETNHDDAAIVESRLRNMNYGTNKQ